MQLVLPVALAQLVFRQPEIGEPGQELRLEDLLAAVEAVAGEPDHLLLAEAQRARMVELRAQLALVDLVGEPDRGRAVDQREGRLDVGIEPPDHLQHQQLVEIRVEQAADDRIELPGVVVDPSRDIGLGHDVDAPAECRRGRLRPERRPYMHQNSRMPDTLRRGMLRVWVAGSMPQQRAPRAIEPRGSALRGLRVAVAGIAYQQ